MAVALATPTFSAGSNPLTAADETQKNEHLWGTIAVDASPATYAPGGLVCAFASGSAPRSGYPPLEIRVWSEPTSGTPSGYTYQYVRGTTQANGKLVIMQDGSTSPSAEIPTAAVPAGVSGDTIRFHAIFARI
jgi:hypothetical protein